MKIFQDVKLRFEFRRPRLERQARRVNRRPRLELLEDRLAPALTLGLGSLTGIVGTAYSQQITTTGGGSNDSYSYSLATAQGDPPRNGLPPGLILNATTGVIHGTPTTPGAYDIVVLVKDNTSGATGEEAFPLNISPLITLSPNLANATQAVPVSGEVITATGPAGDSYTFTASGNLPPVLALVTTGATTAQLQGTPNQYGTFSFTVTATDANGNAGVQPYQMTISPDIIFNPAPVAGIETDGGSAVSFPNLLPTVAVVGRPYSQTITASSANGLASMTFNTNNGGALPAGLRITTTASSLTISGTPTAPTQESSPVHINLTGHDTRGNTTAAVYELDVEANNASPYVAIQAQQGGTLDDDLPAGVVGQAYPTTTFVTPPGSGAYTFSLIDPTFSTTGDGGVPPGMSFNAATATLSGTPTQTGLYSLIIQASSASTGITDSRVFHLTVGAATSGLELGPATLPLASPTVPYSQQITASGGNGTTTLSFSFQNGTLSTLTSLGLNISQPQPNELVISGTPTRTSTLPGTAGPLTLSVTATDSLNNTTTVQYAINVYYTPQQISQAYRLNMITLSGGISGTGAGQTVAIVTKGDAPNLVSTSDPNFANSDLHQFDLAFGLPDPPSFSKLNEFGGNDLPPTGSSSVHETTQDVEWVHALAPQANIVLLESGVNLLVALQTARRIPGVSVVSMSYSLFFDMNSQNNSNFVEPDLDPLFTSPAGHPMTFVISGGDTQSSIANGEFLNHYPAISPNVLAVGYTSLTLNAQGGIAAQPAVAGASGGASTQELQPSYQSGVASAVSTTMRTTPDVTFNGYGAGGSSVAVYDSTEQGDGLPWTFGDGTSISAPSWAALVAIIDQGEVLAGRSPLDGPTQTLPDLYALAGTSAFLPVTTVTNGTVISPAFGSYNPYGGLGSPVANVLVASLVGTPSFSELSAPTITYGTTTTTLSGQIAAGTLIPSGSVAITLDGMTMNASIDPTTGVFSADFPTAALGVADAPYTVTYSYAGNTRFAAASTTTTLTVSPATPIITWFQPADIIYGTALDSGQLDASASWTLGGQSVSVPGTFTYNPPSGTVLSAGDDQTLSVSFSPADTADYTNATASVTINVLPATPSFSGLSSPTITYGTTTTTLSGEIAAGTLIPSGSVGITLDGVTINASIDRTTGAFSADFPTAALGAADSPYSVSYSYGGDANFAPAGSSTTLTVSPATPIITWPQPAEIVYGTALDSSQLDASASWTVGGQSVSVPGTFTFNPPSGTVLNAGDDQTLAVSFSPSDTADYTSASAFLTINVAQHATTTTLIASTPEGAPGQAITFTASVDGGLPSPYLPSGSVQFQINGIDYGSPVPLAADGTATLTTTEPASGSSDVTSIYSGDANFTASQSPAFTETVLNPGVHVVGTTLYVVGAGSNDSILISPVGGRLDGSTGLAVQAVLNKAPTAQTLIGTFTAISIFGYGGNDTIALGPTLTLPTTIVEGDGNNVVRLADGNVSLTLGDGNNQVSGGDGNDDVTVGDGNNVVQLGNGSDVIVEGSGNNVVQLGNGSDLVVGGLGRHTIQLGNGNDILIDGSAAVVNTGDSLRRILSDWNTSSSASVDTRLNVVYNVSHPNVLQAGSGRNWFFFTFGKDVINKKPGDRLN